MSKETTQQLTIAEDRFMAQLAWYTWQGQRQAVEALRDLAYWMDYTVDEDALWAKIAQYETGGDSIQDD
jgi:hypothetical protein